MVRTDTTEGGSIHAAGHHPSLVYATMLLTSEDKDVPVVLVEFIV